MSETRVSRTVSDFEYRATVVNSGAARSVVNATVTAVAPTQVMRAVLHFTNVPASGQAVSQDTFVIRVDRSLPFNISSLTWAYSSANAPIANAGPPQTKQVGQTATLTGAGSTNPSGVGSLTFSWAFASKPPTSAAVIQNPTSVTPSFVVDVPGSYSIKLTVSNGTDGDVAFVTVSTVNSAPVANAGPPQSVNLGATVTLNGSGSTDVDGNPLTFAWTLTNKPASSSAVLVNPNTMNPTFTADKPGSYTASLVVNDGTVSSSNTATVVISTLNSAPTANAGPDQNVNVGATVQLTGAGSSDVDGNPITYLWSLTSVPATSAAVLSSTTLVNPTFVADKPGNYVAQLIVNDGTVSSVADTVTITTNAVGTPTALPGSNQTVKHGALVQLSGSGTDPQGRTLTYLWSLTQKPASSNATLSNTAISNPTFTADRPGDYIAQLIVNNGFVSSAPATVTITTTNSTPTANAGPDQTVALNSLVTLTGAGSADSDSDPITYDWTVLSKPDGSTVTLQGPTSVSPTFTPDVAGVYVIQLIVRDAFATSTPDTVSITTAAPGQIVLTTTTNVGLGGATSFPVNLSTAAPAPGGVTVTLQITDSTKVGLTTTSIFFAAGQTAPATQPTVNGLNLGSSTITASASGYTGATATVNVNATATFNAPTIAITGTATQNLVLTLSANAPASGVVINLTSGTPGVATVPATVTIAAGTNSVNVPVTGVSAGSSIITASGVNIPAVTATANVTASLAIATASLPNGTQNVAYTPLTFASTGGTGSKTWALTGGTLPNGMNFSSAGVLDGTPTVTVTNTALTFRVTDSSSPTAQTASVTLNLTITAVAPTAMVITSGNNQSATVGATFGAPLVVTVTGAGGVPAVGVTVTFTAPGSGATASLPGATNTAVTNGSGVASLPAPTAGTVSGSYNVVASVPSVPSVNFALTNNAGPAASIAVTSGSGQNTIISTAFGAPLVATVSDSHGNPVSGATVTFAVPGSGASATIAGGNTAVTGANGQASSGALTANTVAGTYNVAASAPSVTAVNFALTNRPGDPASITATSGGGQTTTVNTAFTNRLVATVKDASGNPVPGITVLFTPPSVNASVTFATANSALTDALGVATSNVMTANGTAGSYNVVASAVGVTSVTYGLTNTAGAAATMTVNQGAGQNTNVSTPFTSPLSVTIRDASSNPVAGVSVTFTAPGSSATGTFAGGASSVTVNSDASGIATSTIFSANATAGTYNVTATSGSLPAVTFALTNNAIVTVPTIFVGNATVGNGLQTQITITLSQPAPAGGILVNLTTTDFSKAAVAGRSTDPGVVQVQEIEFVQGATTLASYVQGKQNSGTVQVVASAAGWVNGTGTVTLTPSGLVISGPNGAGVDNFSAPKTSTTAVYATSVRLTPALAVAEVQAIAGGTSVSVPVTSSTPAVGTIATPIIIVNPVPQNQSNTSQSSNFKLFTAVDIGATTIALGTPPAPFSVPASGGLQSLTATVTGQGLIAQPVTVGKNLAVPYVLTVNVPAPFGSDIPVTLTSNDPTKLLFSRNPTADGVAVLTGFGATGLYIEGEQSRTQTFYVYGLTDTGSATFTATATGYTSVTGTVTFAKSGFVVAGATGIGGNFSLTPTLEQPLSVKSYMLDAGNNLVVEQPIRGGFTASVNINSSNPSVGQITSSPVTFTGNQSEKTSSVIAGVAGNSTLSISPVTAGFSTPSIGQSMVLTVTTAGIGVPGQITPLRIGKNLQVGGRFFLGATPAEGTVVTLVSNSANLLLSNSATAVGSTTLTFTMTGGTANAEFFLQALTDTGSATYTVSAPGFAPRTGTVNFGKAGLIISGHGGPDALNNNTSATLTGQVIQVWPYVLDVDDTRLENQQLRAGVTINPTITSSNATAGVSFSPITITGGTLFVDAPFTHTYHAPPSITTVLTIVQPAGFTVPLNSGGTPSIYNSLNMSINN